MSTLHGDEPFHCAGDPLPFTVADFWRWGVANLNANALRGLVAEFLVARAVGSVAPSRIEWDAVDLHTPAGTSLEVKCSGYVQTWPQAAPSRPSFDIAPKRSWYAATNSYAPKPGRPASIYVFALHHHRDRDTADPRDVSQWSFFVVPTATLDAVYPTSRALPLPRLQALAGPPTPYHTLGARVRAVESSLPPVSS